MWVPLDKSEGVVKTDFFAASPIHTSCPNFVAISTNQSALGFKGAGFPRYATLCGVNTDWVICATRLVLGRDGDEEGAKTHMLERLFLDLAWGRLNNGKA